MPAQQIQELLHIVIKRWNCKDIFWTRFVSSPQITDPWGLKPSLALSLNPVSRTTALISVCGLRAWKGNSSNRSQDNKQLYFNLLKMHQNKSRGFYFCRAEGLRFWISPPSHVCTLLPDIGLILQLICFNAVKNRMKSEKWLNVVSWIMWLCRPSLHHLSLCNW